MSRPPKLHMFREKLHTIEEIADLQGVKRATIENRIRSGLPLDVEKYQRRHPPVGDRRPGRVGAERIIGTAVNDAKHFAEDTGVRYAYSYFEAGDVLHSAQELAEMFGCKSIEGGMLIREWLRAEMHSAPQPTLEHIGDLIGIVRERTRQIESRALEKLRESPKTRAKVREMRETVIELGRMRKVV